MKLRRTGTQKKGENFLSFAASQRLSRLTKPLAGKRQVADCSRNASVRESGLGCRIPGEDQREDRIWNYTDCHASQRTKTLGGKKTDRRLQPERERSEVGARLPHTGRK